MTKIDVSLTVKQAEVILDALERAMRSAANGNGNINYLRCERAFGKINAKLPSDKKKRFVDLG